MPDPEPQKPRKSWTPPGGTTFEPLELDPFDLATHTDLDAYGKVLLGRLKTALSERMAYFNHLRNKVASVNRNRRILAWLGAIAIVLTAMATAARMVNEVADDLFKSADLLLLLIVLLLYAAMGAISFFETSTDSVSSYFRYVSIVISMRDHWTRFQFEVSKVLRSRIPDNADSDRATGQRILELGEAFWTDVEALSKGEVETWQAEFQASVSHLAEVAEGGLGTIETRLNKSIDDLNAVRAKERAARETEKPAFVNLSIQGAFTGVAAIQLDGVPLTTTSRKSVALSGIKPGLHQLEVRASGVGGVVLEATKHVDLKSGLQDETIVLA